MVSKSKETWLELCTHNISLTLTPRLACFDENCFNFCNNTHYLLVWLRAQRTELQFSFQPQGVSVSWTYSTMQLFLLILQCFMSVLEPTAVTVKSLGAFYNNTCKMAGHVTEQDQWGRSKMYGITDRQGRYLCGVLFLWFFVVGPSLTIGFSAFSPKCTFHNAQYRLHYWLLLELMS